MVLSWSQYGHSMPRPQSDRVRNLRVNVSDEELEMLRALAANAGVTSSDIIRLLVREAHRTTIATKGKKVRR